MAVSACSSPGDDDLQQWMAQQRANVQPKAETVHPPTAFQPQVYLVSDAVSPFAEERLISALRADLASAAASRLLEAEQRRQREPLEEFPLDAMAMVGMLHQGGKRVALLRVNGLLYTVGVGNHLGQNYGRITAITENQITLREIVQDAAGEWVERIATLQLQEGSGK
ncbi:pilus assembly protein PilP [Tepidimonas charontis]|nr:pilus assembly protein PilP [Tepidimonas charontis]